MKNFFNSLCFAVLLSGCVAKSQFDETLVSYHDVSAQLTKVTQEREQCKARTLDLERKNSELEERNQDLSNTSQLLLSKSRTYAEKSVDTQKEMLKIKQEVETKNDKAAFIPKFYNDFVRAFSAEIGDSQAKVSKEATRVTLILSDENLFVPGGIEFQKSGMDLLKKAAPILKSVREQSIDVGAHTDPTPLTGKQKKLFGTLWELSALRATKVVRALETLGVSSKKLAATGYGPNRPMSSNEIHEGRMQNRRIEISISNE